MREGYYNLKKLAGMHEWEWDQLAAEELDEIRDLLLQVADAKTASTDRVPADNPSRATLSRP